MGRRSTRETGDIAEKHARRVMKQHGYRILETNYWGAGAEVDIVASKDDSIVFAEVKSGSTDEFGSPREWVGRAKQRKLTRAAVVFLKSRRLSNTSWRFDVVEVIFGPDGEVASAEIIENAFEPRGIF
ncbi:MAG: YraN family protein [Armatimonadota bacterium]|jgi:putative endonuclease